MSSTRTEGQRWTSDVVEACETCERETRHSVTVEMRSENPDSAFAREPYRVAECCECGRASTTRMNNA